MRLAARFSLKSGCLRAKRGVVIVKNNLVLVKAYNLIFPENDFCQKHGCLRDKLKLGLGKDPEKCRSIHAEAKAISLAAKAGISIKGTAAYITGAPCVNCAKLMFSAGVRKVFYLDIYADNTGEVFLQKMGVACQRIKLSDDKPEKRLRDIRGQS